VANAINNNLESLLNWFELVYVLVEYTPQVTFALVTPEHFHKVITH
jgi:hypothetical protein